jgi:nucleoside-diphosphate-sugar epimerase
MAFTDTLDYIFEQAKKNGFSFLILMLFTYYIYEQRITDMEILRTERANSDGLLYERINRLEEKVDECNKYNIDMMRTTIHENTRELIKVEDLIRENNNLIKSRR